MHVTRRNQYAQRLCTGNALYSFNSIFFAVIGGATACSDSCWSRHTSHGAVSEVGKVVG